MRRHVTGILLASVVVLGCAWTAHASDVRPFPMKATAQPNTGEIRLEPLPAQMAALRSVTEVTLVGVPVPGGGFASLELERVKLALAEGAIHVNGVPQDGFSDPTLTLWSGKVQGQDDSDAFLVLSAHGSRGWFGRDGEVTHLLAEPGADGKWTSSRSRLVSAEWLTGTGFQPDIRCSVLDTPIDVDGSLPGQHSDEPPATAALLPYYDAPIAFETDYEFYQIFNNLNAAQAYGFSLIGALSDRYREQPGAIYSLPYVGFHSVNNDGWTNTDCFGRLEQFRSTWANGGAPVTAELYHMISGVPVNGCGGVAYLDALCDQGFGFGMSAHIDGNLSFPPTQGPLTWDFMVTAHELGHNFGSPHTHDYNPRIDNCAGGDCSVTPNGTIMSYCHSCPGGMNNITLFFHDRVVNHIRSDILSSCLQPFKGVFTEDVGNALPGSNGTPELEVTFSTGPDRVNFSVQNAPTNQAGILIAGFTRIDQPTFGGVLVPNLDVVVNVVANGSGDVNFAVNTGGASFPAGITFWTQGWFSDPSGANPFAVTNGVEIELITP
ncbi:MAG: M12 family metallo-peptidase [Planctomycetota bacterium]